MIIAKTKRISFLLCSEFILFALFETIEYIRKGDPIREALWHKVAGATMLGILIIFIYLFIYMLLVGYAANYYFQRYKRGKIRAKDIKVCSDRFYEYIVSKIKEEDSERSE